MIISEDPHDAFGADRYEPAWAAGPAYVGNGAWSSERKVVHLVLVGGRLVESWSERAEGTRWEHPSANGPARSCSSPATSTRPSWTG